MVSDHSLVIHSLFMSRSNSIVTIKLYLEMQALLYCMYLRNIERRELENGIIEPC